MLVLSRMAQSSFGEAKRRSTINEWLVEGFETVRY